MAFFRGLMGGGANVETVLHSSQVHPGGAVQGVINVTGGSVDRDVNFVEASLVARVEVETQDSEYDANVVFHRHRLTGPFRLQAGARVPIPFTLSVPWETPFNVVGGSQLPKVRVGVRTELDISRSIDKTDVDQLQVLALPAQERVVAGLAQIGFRFKGADLERGRIRGSQLPFYQEVEFYAAPQFRGKLNELEVTFITGPTSMDVLLEIDRRTMFSSGDRVNRFTVDLATAEQQDWATVLNEHIGRIAGSTGMFGGGGRVTPRFAPAPPPAQSYGQPTAPSYGTPPPPPSYGTPPPAPTGPPSQPGHGGISMARGATVNLSQHVPGLSSVLVGLGWDSAAQGASLDLDAAAIVADASRRALSDQHFVFFNNLASPEGAVKHSGDNTAGAQSGDAESILVDLGKVPPQASLLAFSVSMHDSGGPGFGQVRNAYIRVVNRADGRELARFDLSQQAHAETAVVFGELTRSGGEWTFRAIGQPVAGGLAGFARGFGLNV